MRPLKRPDSDPGPRRFWRDLCATIRRWRQELGWLAAAYRAHRRGPVLLDMARRGRIHQSSFRGSKGAPGSYRGNARFRSTLVQAHPWWMVELKHDWPIHTIRIHNRPDEARLATQLVVSVSRDGQEWRVVHAGTHHFGDAAAPGPLDIRLLGRHGGRYVRIELPHRGQLRLRRVEVLIDRRHWALRRTCLKYGFRFPLMTALRANHPTMKSYGVDHAPRRFDGKVQALHVGDRVGRFGNHLKQIVNAITLARRLGISKVYVMPFPEFEAVAPIEAGGVTLLPESRLAADRPGAVLRGSFFYLRQFSGTVKASDMAWAIDHFVRPLFLRKAKRPSLQPRESDLAVHIRSGDIFAMPQPLFAYVQPPLAYYQLCVATARRLLGIERVILVYENELNPCVAPLKRWLAETGCPFVTQSASLHEDLAVLLHARHCVFGAGSFGRAVTLLSESMTTLFYSWLEPACERVAESRQLRTVVASDAAGGYMKQGEWRCSPDQIRMLLDYPASNLALTVVPPDAGVDRIPAELQAAASAP